MLPAAHRMRASADFTLTTRCGARAARGSVVVHFHPSSDATASGPALVGLTVGKAVGNSVARHRASRRLRGILRPLVARLPAESRLVVRALPGAATDPHLAQDVIASVETAISKAGVP